MGIQINRHAIPIPRVFAHIHPDYENTTVSIGLEIGDAHGDPILYADIQWPWLRPRPWEMDLALPLRPREICAWRWRKAVDQEPSP